ncbi:Unknown protein sequence [Pseudomonas syringae pv. rhaphiolepidis]|nr:Unknown protein sequence [Pseudomonas syringae pv. rhaphiolepidis]
MSELMASNDQAVKQVTVIVHIAVGEAIGELQGWPAADSYDSGKQGGITVEIANHIRLEIVMMHRLEVPNQSCNYILVGKQYLSPRFVD